MLTLTLNRTYLTADMAGLEPATFYFARRPPKARKLRAKKLLQYMGEWRSFFFFLTDLYHWLFSWSKCRFETVKNSEQVGTGQLQFETITKETKYILFKTVRNTYLTRCIEIFNKI